MFLLKTHSLRQLLRDGEYLGDNMLGHYRAMDFAGIGKNDITIHQFREQ
jgi:hypothetical protein